MNNFYYCFLGVRRDDGISHAIMVMRTCEHKQAYSNTVNVTHNRPKIPHPRNENRFLEG